MVELAVPDGVSSDDPTYVENPVTGERFRFHSSPADPETDPLALDIWATPEMSPLAEHVHAKQDETFVVNDGTIEVRRNGVGSEYREGEAVTIEAGTPHSWTNAGDARLHLTVRFQPGLQTEAFLRDLAALARRGEVGSDGAPSLLQVAALYDAYGYELLHLASPPLRLQKVVFGALAPLASALGYRANPVEAVTGHRQ
ncbi:cupin domain-containing protein [Haloarchaeobius litoreus]|uniref:Cupin domain-containing protein n=1 Tax=Haloarchaeobius litoreus TaxID=755306 RepID=A0ABD6DJX9_9EURY|nr:cupin domain-containing protein [Haloarchaeobius litoreus]